MRHHVESTEGPGGEQALDEMERQMENQTEQDQMEEFYHDIPPDLMETSESDLEDPHLYSPPPQPNTNPYRTTLSKLTDEQIMAALVERCAAFVCQCGLIFSQQSMYNSHKEWHGTKQPKQCSHCGYTATNWNQFMHHIFTHGKAQGDSHS